jgi:hypothetical protein
MSHRSRIEKDYRTGPLVPGFTRRAIFGAIHKGRQTQKLWNKAGRKATTSPAWAKAKSVGEQCVRSFYDVAYLDVDSADSLVSCHPCANDFESEVICQPIVGWQLNVILFTSCIVKHCECKFQKTFSCTAIGGG